MDAWLKKIETALGSDTNPTKYSLLFWLNNLTEKANKLAQYESIGSVDEFRQLKEKNKEDKET